VQPDLFGQWRPMSTRSRIGNADRAGQLLFPPGSRQDAVDKLRQ